SAFLDDYTRALATAVSGYVDEGRAFATVALGCTGGKHRSVAMSEELARRLRQATGVRVSVRHRDLGSE
ncbi:MAG TPA: RNase adapter RapZ, partial [Brevibacterium sp.]|nr:RNase adapter RapZ [Brevibacterium sp.]